MPFRKAIARSRSKDKMLYVTECCGASMRGIVTAAAALATLTLSSAMDFKPPGPAERLEAIGSTEELPKALQAAFDPGPHFDPVPIPGSSDWLAVHPEPGQTSAGFVKSSPRRPDRIRKKIYLQPLGEFPKDQPDLTESLEDYAAAYFCMEVELLPPLDLSACSLTTRVNPLTKNRQILTGDVLALLTERLPADAFCSLAITMEDLYPHSSWNFVFGQASPREGVGVYSFARYDPMFYGTKRGKDYRQLLLRRSCRVLPHETAHMFGLNHCIFFRCVLNGSNHLQESDSRPLHLCPVCLRKLQWSVRFDVADRYRRLLSFYREAGLDKEARWVGSRLEWILRDGAAREQD